MMPSLLFLLKEGFVGLLRSRGSALMAIVTITVSLVLIGLFLIVTLNLNEFAENLKKRLEVTVFLDDSFDEDKTRRIREHILALQSIGSVDYVSKEMAVAEFREHSERLNVDYLEVLGFNPLPASFRLHPVAEFLSSGGVAEIVQQLEAIDGIEELDIKYEKNLLPLLESRLQVIVAIDIVIGVVLCVGALLLVSNNVRLIILSRERLITTMKLVGATPMFVQAPMFIQGFLQGFLGGIAAAVLLFLLTELAAVELPDIVAVGAGVYGLVVVLGILLGFSGSLTAVRRFL